MAARIGRVEGPDGTYRKIRTQTGQTVHQRPDGQFISEDRFNEVLSDAPGFNLQTTGRVDRAGAFIPPQEAAYFDPDAGRWRAGSDVQRFDPDVQPGQFLSRERALAIQRPATNANAFSGFWHRRQQATGDTLSLEEAEEAYAAFLKEMELAADAEARLEIEERWLDYG